MATILVPQDGRRIGVLSEGFAIAPGENLHHPMMEVIDGMILDRAEAPIVFLAGLVKIAAQPMADIFVLAAKGDILGSQEFDVLHGHFCEAVRATMQVL